MNESKKIFISALDWGLGHAARCIPVINELQKHGCEITIGGTGRSGSLLRREFPFIEYVEIPGFTPKSGRNSLGVKFLFRNFPQLLTGSIKEYNYLKNLLKTRSFDIIISDHRYGLYSKRAYSIMIIHQLKYFGPGFLNYFSGITLLLNRWLLSRFDKVWIPDLAGTENLSGELSHNIRLSENMVFIGQLSRFASFRKLAEHVKTHILVILSGPEPQRTEFEKLILSQARSINKKIVIAAGQPELEFTETTSGNIIRYSHVSENQMQELIAGAELVITRAGYSTIMDLSFTDCKVLFIPTPGQSEQEYLACRLMENGLALSVNQHQLNLPEQLVKAMSYKGLHQPHDASLLANTINNLLKIEK